MLIQGLTIQLTSLVVEERGISKGIPRPAHMHGVAEVAQRGTDHLRCEVHAGAALGVHGAGHQLLEDGHLARGEGRQGLPRQLAGLESDLKSGGWKGR